MEGIIKCGRLLQIRAQHLFYFAYVMEIKLDSWKKIRIFAIEGNTRNLKERS